MKETLQVTTGVSYTNDGLWFPSNGKSPGLFHKKLIFASRQFVAQEKEHEESLQLVIQDVFTTDENVTHLPTFTIVNHSSSKTQRKSISPIN